MALFVWARSRALNSKKLRFPARAVSGHLNFVNIFGQLKKQHPTAFGAASRVLHPEPQRSASISWKRTACTSPASNAVLLGAAARDFPGGGAGQ